MGGGEPEIHPHSIFLVIMVEVLMPPEATGAHL